jgi:hypothetical protein
MDVDSYLMVLVAIENSHVPFEYNLGKDIN